MNNVRKIIIDPRFIIGYTSYYILGLKRLFPHAQIAWKCMEGLSVTSINDYREGLAAQLLDCDGNAKKIFIATNDSNKIIEKFYDWADIYGKINVAPKDKNRNKLVVMGPGFGIQLWNPFKTLYLAIRNYSRCGIFFPIPFKRYVLDYMYTFVRRLPLDKYCKECRADENYIFTLSTLWYNQHAVDCINRYRGAFIRACQKVYPKFEGGFRYVDGADVIAECPDYPKYLQEYGDVIVYDRISMKDYMEKTSKSDIVFNTPSVIGCHGWKLGEYLAMGKAIISTSLNNEMPADFLSGVHYILADTEEDILSVVRCLKNNPEKKRELERAAKEYYLKYVSPEKAIMRLMELC